MNNNASAITELVNRFDYSYGGRYIPYTKVCHLKWKEIGIYKVQRITLSRSETGIPFNNFRRGMK